MSLVNTKSMLAKLLASENITVEHGNYETASMDVKNRVLRLPIWKEMSGSLYDLMVLHEVGHALYTPEDGWHESASSKGAGYKSFLNVVEDARIERKIKDKYPGGRRAFTEGYLDLISKDFFGIKGMDLNDLNLIDRINLYFKGGFVHDIEFSDEEMEFVDKVSKTMTWDDVVRVTDELYSYARETESETDMSDHSMMSFGDGEGEEGEGEEMEMDMAGEEPAESFEDMLEKLGRRGLEAGDEEKEESETDGPSAENEGESKDSDDEGKSAGDESADGEESDDIGTSPSDKDSENPESIDNDSFGTGAGRGKPAEAGGSFEIDPTSLTDKNFRERESELVQSPESGYSYDYGNMPVADTDKIIIDHKEIHDLISSHYTKAKEYNNASDQIERATKTFVEFRAKNKKTVEYLAKEFEMKKAADAHSRTATANSGILDTGMLHEYKYNEHIFKKINITTDGKNHGLVMVVDWSGSMNGNIKGSIEQMMVLVMFAKRVNIPFEVFLFSDSYPSGRYRSRAISDEKGWTHKDGGKRGDLVINGYHLLNVFSSRMRANELHTAYINMTAIAGCYDRDFYYQHYRTMPTEMSLGGTPLNDSLLTMHTYLPEFKAKNNVQIVNLIYLTDGDSAGGEYVWERRTETRKNYDGSTSERYVEIRNLERGYQWNATRSRTKTVIRDNKTKKEYVMQISSGGRFSRNDLTNTLVEILRDTHGCNVVNFYIIPKLSRHDMIDFVPKSSENKMVDMDKLHSSWRKEGHVIGQNYGGWSELYLIRGGRNLDVVETNLDVNTGAKKGEIKRAFAKMNKNKLKNRLLLSKFVDMVAA